MRPTLRRILAGASAILVTLPVAAALTSAPAHAASTSVVISEVYGGGGNAGARYTHDFVELGNRSDTAVDLTGWKVTYFSASGGAGGSVTLTGRIEPRRGYLIQQAKGSGGNTPLPAPDAIGTSAMSATNGRVDLYDPSGILVDRVGYGSANQFEGAAAGALSNTTSAARTGTCTDTDNNAADFAGTEPTAENSTQAVCDGTDQPTGQIATIPQIQGAAHLSPLERTVVSEVPGIVTATSNNGYWMQNATPDDDVRTSEGIFVYTRVAPQVRSGDAVTVAGRVSEFRPGGASGTNNTTITQLVEPQTSIRSSGNPLPAPVILGVDRIAPAQVIEALEIGSVESEANEFAVDRDAIDFYESLEGMWVGVSDATVVGPTQSFGEIAVVPGQNVSATRSDVGGVVYGSYDQPNSMRIQLDDALIGSGAMPKANAGDTLPGVVSGVVDYSFANYKIQVSAAPQVSAGPARREVARAQTGRDLSIAAFNLNNLTDGSPPEKFAGLASQVVTNLRSPDILAVEEIQDDSGPANDGTVDSSRTVGRLIAAIRDAGGPAYQARWVNPENNQDGGQPGANIRSVFLYRPDRGVAFVDIAGAEGARAAEPVKNRVGRRGVSLTASPGLVDPTNQAWEATRKPLLGQFTFRGQTVFAMAIHLSSKGGDEPLFGRWQQPERSSEVKRHQQARAIRAWSERLLALDPGAKLAIAGDLNDFEFSKTADIVAGTDADSTGAQFTDLTRTLPASERYTYIYEGNSQVLDHIFTSPALTTSWYDIVRTNSPFWDQVTDHDPQVAHLAVTK